MKKLIYTLLLLLVTFPAMAQSLFEQYERFLTEPRTYVCYRPDGKLKIDGKLNESSWKKATPTAPLGDAYRPVCRYKRRRIPDSQI